MRTSLFLIALSILACSGPTQPAHHGVRTVANPYRSVPEQVSALRPECDDQNHNCKQRIAYQGDDDFWYVYTWSTYDSSPSTYTRSDGGLSVPMGGSWARTPSPPPAGDVVSVSTVNVTENINSGAPEADNDQGGPAGGGDVEGPDANEGATEGEAGPSGDNDPGGPAGGGDVDGPGDAGSSDAGSSGGDAGGGGGDGGGGDGGGGGD